MLGVVFFYIKRQLSYIYENMSVYFGISLVRGEVGALRFGSGAGAAYLTTEWYTVPFKR